MWVDLIRNRTLGSLQIGCRCAQEIFSSVYLPFGSVKLTPFRSNSLR